MTREDFYSPETHNIGGLPVKSATPTAAARDVIDSALAGPARHFHLVNAYSTVCAEENPDVAASLQNGATNYPDGKPLYWIGRFVRRDREFSQVRGPGLFQEVIIRSTPEVRHFFLGSTPEVLSQLEWAAKRLNPKVTIAGLDSPPYSAADRTEWNRRNAAIIASKANLVWVGLGTPKQDLEAQRLTEETMITAVAVGAAFDFLAGSTKEAPAWMQKVGFEWLFRFLSEPRRLWKRYLLGNVKFIILAFRRG